MIVIQIFTYLEIQDGTSFSNHNFKILRILINKRFLIEAASNLLFFPFCVDKRYRIGKLGILRFTRVLFSEEQFIYTFLRQQI